MLILIFYDYYDLKKSLFFFFKGQKLNLRELSFELKQRCFDCFHFSAFFFFGFCFCCYKVLTWVSQQMVGTNGGYLLPENEKRECAFINSDPELDQEVTELLF